MNRKEGSGRPRSLKTEQNTDLIEESICSQEEALHANLAPSKIAEQTGISQSSIRRMIKRRNFRQFKTVKTPKINDGCCNRRYACAIALAEKFERNTCMTEKTVWQDEKDFTLDVPDYNLFVSLNKMSRKVTVSAAISWYGTMKPFFVNENGIKVNKDNYCKHLKNSCLLQLKNLLSVMTGYLSKMVLRHINRIWYKIPLKKL